ncbi:hypothetical protein QE152_g5692 [Popillia japonica]|uniref:Uncharacterized protein n=1 Tax=Popillia japonica TaxID=7064 RepID=A0AAW1MM18_POPJA
MMAATGLTQYQVRHRREKPEQVRYLERAKRKLQQGGIKSFAKAASSAPAARRSPKGSFSSPPVPGSPVAATSRGKAVLVSRPATRMPPPSGRGFSPRVLHLSPNSRLRVPVLPSLRPRLQRSPHPLCRVCRYQCPRLLLPIVGA